MKKIFYEKQGRKYIPIAEYDNNFLDSFPKGNTLVMCYPGGTTRRFNVDPNYAAMIAAGRLAEDVISKRIHEVSEIRRQHRGNTTPLTPSQKAAWDNLVKEFGEDARQLEWASTREIAEEAVKAMMEEADKLMLHPAVQKAYDNFQIVCKLISESERHEVK